VSPFIAHLVGDFLLQNEWMATRKTSSSLACSVHVLVYLVPFLLCSLEWWQLALIGLQHFLQDRTRMVAWWMRWWKRTAVDTPSELALAVDQSIHLLAIELVLLLGQGRLLAAPGLS
jgi:hypothetical protein